MKIAAVTILFNPDKIFLERIKSYAPFVDKFYLIDNSDKGFFKHEADLANPSIKYITNQQNEGIAKPLNSAARMAIAEGFDWLLTMDQDSSFADGDFLKYINCILNYDMRSEVGMFGVEHDSRKNIYHDCHFDFISHLITSGSLLNLKVYQATNGFDENLFIDHVDHDFCLQVLSGGFKIMKLNNILLDHKIGSTSKNISFKSFEKTNRTLHPPLRMYYILRNYLYLKKKYKDQFVKEFEEITTGVKNSIKNNLLYNKERGSVLKYIYMAIRDFRKGKMGKLN